MDHMVWQAKGQQNRSPINATNMQLLDSINNSNDRKVLIHEQIPLNV